VTFTVESDAGRDGVDVIGDEPIWHDGEVVGWVTSGGYAHHSETSVAMGYVPAALAESDGPWQIEIIGDMKTATRVDGCIWDPDAERMRA
jgi:dimethylglycine dehydrogenase